VSGLGETGIPEGSQLRNYRSLSRPKKILMKYFGLIIALGSVALLPSAVVRAQAREIRIAAAAI